MRLFTGISLAQNVIDSLSLLLNELKPTASINWSPIDNLHITCKFIGAWPEDRLPDLKTALSAIPASGPIPIAIAQLGFFPHANHPHFLFAGVQPEPTLTELATAIDQALVPLGCPPETRPFHPHVTLGRIKHPSDLSALHERIAAMTDFDFGSFHTREFHLYLSRPAKRGSAYTKLATYDLVREQNSI